jgi:hypothetical protein
MEMLSVDGDDEGEGERERERERNGEWSLLTSCESGMSMIEGALTIESVIDRK